MTCLRINPLISGLSPSRRWRSGPPWVAAICDVDPSAGEVVTSFEGRSVTYGFGELDMLVPAYAATIHKSQGSEYPAVVIPVMTQHYAMLQRAFSTPVSRVANGWSVLVGQKKPSPSLCATSRVGGGGRSWASGWRWEMSRSHGTHQCLESTSGQSTALWPQRRWIVTGRRCQISGV
jgi:hypothetical protein